MKKICEKIKSRNKFKFLRYFSQMKEMSAKWTLAELLRATLIKGRRESRICKWYWSGKAGSEFFVDLI